MILNLTTFWLKSSTVRFCLLIFLRICILHPTNTFPGSADRVQNPRQRQHDSTALESITKMTPKIDYQNTPACLKTALFFHALPEAIIISLLLCITSIVLTIFIRHITPGVGDQHKASTTGETALVDVERTAIPENIPIIIEPTIEGDAADDQPPPYQHPSPVPPTIRAGFQAPPTPALPAPIGVPQGQSCRVLHDFTKNGAFEMTVKANDLVTVTHKENNGKILVF